VQSIMDWDPPGPKTVRDYLIKDNLDRYCPKTFEMAEGKKKVPTPGVEPSTAGLSRRCSVIEYVHVVGMYVSYCENVGANFANDDICNLFFLKALMYLSHTRISSDGLSTHGNTGGNRNANTLVYCAL